MGFTIEDMLLVSADKYQMKLVAGEKGWSNSISWLLMLEDLTIIQHFSGKELAVTTGLGFQTEQKMLKLVEMLDERNAAGLLFNTGCYVHEVPESVIQFCDEHELPLLTVPWEVLLPDLIKDVSVRIFLQSSADEQISAAMISAIENPQSSDRYTQELLPFFDLDGTFEVALVSTGDLDRMDTVDRRRIGYRMQLYLTNLTHNGHFMYYDSCFVIIMNAMTAEDSAEILEAFAKKARLRFTDREIYIGVSNVVQNIGNLHVAYRRAKAAVEMAETRKKTLLYFDDMGIFRLLYMSEDRELLREMSEVPLAPLLEYDRLHDAGYVETLSSFLRHAGSIKAMAEEMYVHRNTIMYRMANIKKLLGCDLETPRERLTYTMACMILEM